jgi:hypothetical protein
MRGAAGLALLLASLAAGAASPLENDAAPESIHSHLIGEFRGWSRGTEFQLANGQVWKDAGDRDAFYPDVPNDAAVVIRRGFLGSYWMEVLGSSHTIKVKVRRLR